MVSSEQCSCGQPIAHARVGLCSICYKEKRKQYWKAKHILRSKIPGYSENRKIKNTIAAIAWQKLNRSRIAERQKERCATDLNFKLTRILRKRISEAIKNEYKSGSAVENLGCSIDVCRIHIESQFDTDMSWTNYGEWHIDHIKPLRDFTLSDPKQMAEACRYTNLQPLWASDNLRKG